MNVSQWLEQCEEVLDRAGISSARLDAQLMLAAQLGATRANLFAHPEQNLSPEQLKALEIMQNQRLERRPMAYITGQAEFYGRPFLVTPDVLIPRPESEQIIESALPLIANSSRVLDVGTGSGCLGITVALERPKTKVVAADISPAALKIARRNAKRLNAKLEFVQSDLFEQINGTYRVILANLPYVSPTWAVSPETNFEPAQALFAPADGLAVYRRLLQTVSSHLAPGGWLIIEIDPRQAKTVSSLAQQHGLSFESASNFVYLLKQA